MIKKKKKKKARYEMVCNNNGKRYLIMKDFPII